MVVGTDQEDQEDIKLGDLYPDMLNTKDLFGTRNPDNQGETNLNRIESKFYIFVFYIDFRRFWGKYDSRA